MSAQSVRVTKPTNKESAPGSGLPTFRCSGCRKHHHIGLYAVAQCAMGHVMTHTCDCGQRHSVKGSGGSHKVYAIAQAGAGNQGEVGNG